MKPTTHWEGCPISTPHWVRGSPAKNKSSSTSVIVQPSCLVWILSGQKLWLRNSKICFYSADCLFILVKILLIICNFSNSREDIAAASCVQGKTLGGSLEKDWKYSFWLIRSSESTFVCTFSFTFFPASLQFGEHTGIPEGNVLIFRTPFDPVFPFHDSFHSHICFFILFSSMHMLNINGSHDTHTHIYTHWVEPLFCINISTARRTAQMSKLRGQRLRCHGYKDLFGRRRVFPERTPEVPEDMPAPLKHGWALIVCIWAVT